MNLCCTMLRLLFICNTTVCRHDYYAGVFNKNDFLVAQDVFYKDKAFYHTTKANYVKAFKCPISYYRVQDRLGVAQGPGIKRLKGGLGQDFLILRFTSVFNQPINVNIYIACANKQIGKNEPIYTRAPWTRAAKTTKTNAGKTNADVAKTTVDSGASKIDGHSAITATDQVANGVKGETTTGGEKGETTAVGEKVESKVEVAASANNIEMTARLKILLLKRKYTKGHWTIAKSTVKTTTNANSTVKTTTSAKAALKTTTSAKFAVKTTTSAKSAVKTTTNAKSAVKTITNANSKIKTTTSVTVKSAVKTTTTAKFTEKTTTNANSTVNTTTNAMSTGKITKKVKSTVKITKKARSTEKSDTTRPVVLAGVTTEDKRRRKRKTPATTDHNFYY